MGPVSCMWPIVDINVVMQYMTTHLDQGGPVVFSAMMGTLRSVLSHSVATWNVASTTEEMNL